MRPATVSYRVYACDVCRRYLKAYDARNASRPVLVGVDTIATLPLDAAAMQRGYVGCPDSYEHGERRGLPGLSGAAAGGAVAKIVDALAANQLKRFCGLEEPTGVRPRAEHHDRDLLVALAADAAASPGSSRTSR